MEWDWIWLVFVDNIGFAWVLSNYKLKI